MNIYRNNKHGTLYDVLKTDVINCTNSENNKKMVYYVSHIISGRLRVNESYVREYKEFMKKFTKIMNRM